MSNLKVLVVGASIAGPTAAYWLAKTGAHVTIIERFPNLRAGGQNIDIRTIGVSVMRKMAGMEAAVRAKKMDIEGISFVRENGRPYGTITPTGNPDQQSLVSEYEIFRGDLAQILFDMTKDNENIKYVFGEQVTAIHQKEQAGGPVTVEFANGFPTSEYDLVVACDGATSRTRAIGLGCDVHDHIESTNSWAAYFSLEEDFFHRSKVGHGYSAPGGRFIAVGSGHAGGSQVSLMGIHPRHDRDATLRFREAMKKGDGALKQVIAQHYEGAGWITEKLLKGMMGAEDLYAAEIVQVKVPSIRRGSFVLVGDAGYAPGPTGFGTSLAIAGAYILAGEVGKHKSNLAAGLQGYEEQMKPLICEMQKIPPLVFTILAPQTACGIWLRNNIFGFVAWTGVAEFASRYVANAFSKTEKYKLPEYKWET